MVGGVNCDCANGKAGLLVSQWEPVCSRINRLPHAALRRTGINRRGSHRVDGQRGDATAIILPCCDGLRANQVPRRLHNSGVGCNPGLQLSLKAQMLLYLSNRLRAYALRDGLERVLALVIEPLPALVHVVGFLGFVLVALLLLHRQGAICVPFRSLWS